MLTMLRRRVLPSARRRGAARGQGCANDQSSQNVAMRPEGMTVRAATRGASVIAVLSVLTTLASVALWLDNRAVLASAPHYLFGDATAGVLYPVAGALLLRRRADAPVAWIFAATSVLGLNAFCNQYAVAAYLAHPGLPLGAVAAWIASWGWTPALVVPALVPLLFPDGTLPSPRWRAYVRVVAAVLAVTTLAAMFTAAPIDASDRITNPLGTNRVVAALVPAGAVLALFVFTPVAIVSLILRQRRARGVQRAQLSWLSLAAVVCIVAIAAMSVVPGYWSEVAWTIAVAAIPAGVVIAVLRHRLLDIEVVLNRSVVYVLLTGVVLAAYVAAVTGVGQISQRTGIVAVAVLVLLLASVRQRLQQWVERTLYGNRGNPYAVVSRVGQRLDTADGPVDALRRLAEEVRESLRLPYVAVRALDERVPTVESGRPVAGTVDLPVVVLGTTVAELAVGLRHRGERLRSADLGLLTDVARRAGALVQAATLVADVQRSRERLVAAREEERRRLRRDLHDGVGPDLAGMALQLDSLAGRLDDDPALAERARRLRDRMRRTVTEVRRVVDELRPPALDQLGLAEALREHLSVYAGSPDGTAVTLSVGRLLTELPAATEVAAYRIAAEAVANAVRHGYARHCDVALRETEGGLLVEVSDDGTGIAGAARAGVGLQSMRERATEIGGRFDLVTGPQGTTVRAVLPLEAT